MSEDVCRIEKLENGYAVEVLDPVIQASNQQPKAMYRDPWKEYAFKTDKEAIAFVTKVLPTLSPENEDMGKMFNDACAEAED